MEGVEGAGHRATLQTAVPEGLSFTSEGRNVLDGPIAVAARAVPKRSEGPRQLARQKAEAPSLANRWMHVTDGELDIADGTRLPAHATVAWVTGG
jgi:hypothetical protein